MKGLLQIAIDGPVASGKSTVAKLLSERLRLLYVDTGAMYRALALAAKNKRIDWGNQQEIVSLVSVVKIRLVKPQGERKDGRTVTVWLGNRDVSWEIRTQEIAEGASVVSQYGRVREVLVKQQQAMAKRQGVVMEGRDIGTRVLVNAPLKIFMSASVEKRVKWKRAQMKAQGQVLPMKSVREALLKRDRREMKRKVDPLRPAKGAWRLDTSELSIEEVVERIVERVKKL